MKCLTTLSIMIALFIGAIPSNTVFAQHDHSAHGHAGHAQMNTPPHGGSLRSVGKYNIEMVVDMLQAQNQMVFYLYKANMKPIGNSDMKGSVTIEMKDGSSTNADLHSYGERGFATDLKDTRPFNCTVRFEIKGKTVSTYFSHNGLGEGAAAVYTCSMHPEVQSDAPGQCPKCGMFLEKQ